MENEEDETKQKQRKELEETTLKKALNELTHRLVSFIFY